MFFCARLFNSEIWQVVLCPFVACHCPKQINHDFCGWELHFPLSIGFTDKFFLYLDKTVNFSDYFNHVKILYLVAVDVFIDN